VVVTLRRNKLIENYINKRWSIADMTLPKYQTDEYDPPEDAGLTDEEFEEILPTLVTELSEIDFTHNYTDEALKKDWEKLKKTDFGKDTSSTTRVGMKLCEHFFPNFYDIESNGKTFRVLWKDTTLLEKVLRANRKMHSTPYLSELKRMIYFSGGLPKHTMFRPHLAKAIVSEFGGERVLDPCCGWGGRLLGTVASGKHYVGFEPNLETYLNLVKMVNFLGIQKEVTLFNDVAEDMTEYEFDNVDIVLTSPPYFDYEVYCDSADQCENKFDTYDDWKDDWLKDVIKKSVDKLNPDGVSCWNTHNVTKMPIIADVENIHLEFGFNIEDIFSLKSSSRPTNLGEVKKSEDITVCYRK
jgi:tRNA G10  N-methylase Trm11